MLYTARGSLHFLAISIYFAFRFCLISCGGPVLKHRSAADKYTEALQARLMELEEISKQREAEV